MHSTEFRYSTNKANLTDNHTVHKSKTSAILTRLLLERNVRPIQLSIALQIPNQEIHQLLNKHEAYAKISTLMLLAKFFKITIGQLIGNDPLDFGATEDYSPKISSNDLSMQCTTLAIQLFKKHNVAFNEKLAVKLIFDIYHYSSCINNGTLNKDFADWYVAQHANKQMV